MGLADSYLTTAQGVTIQTMGASDVYGQAATGASATVRARFTLRQRLVRTAAGEEIQSVAQVLLAASVAVSVDDRITVSGRTYPVVSVEPAYGLGGEVLHRLAYLGA